MDRETVDSIVRVLELLCNTKNEFKEFRNLVRKMREVQSLGCGCGSEDLERQVDEFLKKYDNNDKEMD